MLWNWGLSFGITWSSSDIVTFHLVEHSPFPLLIYLLWRARVVVTTSEGRAERTLSPWRLRGQSWDGPNFFLHCAPGEFLGSNSWEQVLMEPSPSTSQGFLWDTSFLVLERKLSGGVDGELALCSELVPKIWGSYWCSCTWAPTSDLFIPPPAKWRNYCSLQSKNFSWNISVPCCSPAKK